jgi:hypothetical protein
MKPNFLFLNVEILLSVRFDVSVPSMKTLPLEGRSKRPIMLSKVDFPEPELPTINTNSPFSIENDTSSSAFTIFSPTP